MAKVGWLAVKDGFRRVEVLEEAPRFRRVRLLDGGQPGAEVLIPPEGVPNGEFNPALFVQDGEPRVFRYKGRSLPIRDPAEFEDPVQAKALVPREEPYSFQPHTLRLMDAALAGDHVLLCGHKGCGKTSGVLQLAARAGMPVVRLNFTGQLSVSDLVGSVGFGAGGTTWHDGPVVTAMRRGYWLLLDEFDFGDPSVMSLLHSVLERRPSYCLKENNGEVVAAHPRFRVFATCNSLAGDQDGMYAGTQALNAALLDRFAGHGQVVSVQPMKPRQEREVLRELLPHAPDRLIRRASEFAAQLRERHLRAFSTRELVNFVNKVALYRDASEAAEATFLPVVRDEAVRTAVREFTKDWFPRRLVLRVGPSRPPKPPVPAGRNADAPAPGAGGRLASAVTDPAEAEAIWRAHKRNGGDCSYAELERRFGLKPSRGMHAYRVCQRHEASRRQAPPEATVAPAAAPEANAGKGTPPGSAPEAEAK